MSATTLRRHWPLLLAVVLLVAAGAVFWQAGQERDTDNVGNHALIDDRGTTDVQAAVARALVRVFSFDHADPAPTAQAADEVLAGQARKDYDLLFAALEERAPGQELTLTAQVQVAAVQELDGDHAQLLVFLDQASQRAEDEESAISAAQLSVDAELVDGEWRITELRPL